MPRLRQTTEILKLMSKKENVRNIGIVAHIDHGKTTMTDSLLIEAGLLPPQIAGSARVLDYLEEEQRRGITIKTANISLLHEMDGSHYVINLVDTPGHVDFTGKVARALRSIDGAVVMVDAVEEIMTQTETVTRQALEERVKPVLFINKVDRLINEMKLSTDEIQNKFTRIISDFNNLVEVYGEKEFRNQWKVDILKETVVFGSALHRWGFTLDVSRQKRIKFSHIVDAYKKGRHQTLPKLLPLYKAILDMTVKSIPNPIEAQKYRVPRIWKGSVQSELGRAMLNCEDKGPTAMCITNTQIDTKEGLIAVGRLFSGSVKEGDRIYLVSEGKEYSVQQVAMYMGIFRENVNQITAGNIAALSGLSSAKAGETLVDAPHKAAMVPFEPIRYVSEPVMTVVVEPKNPKDLPELVEAMNRLSIEDPNSVTAFSKETGEYLLSGMGELHLEIAIKFLRDYGGGIDLTTSDPTVEHRETISKKGIVAMSKTADKCDTFWVQVEPLEKKTIDLIEKGESVEKAKNVWAVNEHRNILLDLTGKTNQLSEVKDDIISGFNWACRTGPLCEQPLRDIKVKLMNAEISPNADEHEPTQIMRAVSRTVFGSFLTAKPLLLEPVYRIEISVPTRLMGECSKILTRRNGKILTTKQKSTLTIIEGYIPVANTLGLSAQMRSSTSGRVFWQCTFDHWEKMPGNAASQLIKQIRKKKGLPEEIPKPDKFADEPEQRKTQRAK